LGPATIAALGAPTHFRYFRHAGIYKGVPGPDVMQENRKEKEAFVLVLAAASTMIAAVAVAVAVDMKILKKFDKK
jgi:hypothetical protein